MANIKASYIRLLIIKLEVTKTMSEWLRDQPDTDAGALTDVIHHIQQAIDILRQLNP